MEKFDCKEGYNLQEDHHSITVCGWSPDKQWLEEGAEAIATTRRKIVSHGICALHKAAWIAESDAQVNRWEDARNRVAATHDNTLITFSSRDGVPILIPREQ